MKIGIDITSITKQKAGIGNYTYFLTNEFIKYTEHTFYLFGNSKENIDYLDLKDKKNIKFVLVEAKRANVIWMLKVRIKTVFLRLDAFISPSSNFLLSLLFVNSWTIVHDIIPIIFPEYFVGSSSKNFKFLFSLLIKLKRKLFFISKTTYKDVCRIYNQQFDKNIIYAGLNKYGLEKLSANQYVNTSQNRADFKEKNFILSVSTLEPRKNYVNSITAFYEFSKKYGEFKYYIVGKKGWMFDDIQETIKKYNLEEKVVLLNYVNNETLNELYKHCKFFVLVSKYEGFGLPVLEAYSYGKKLLISNIPAFIELNLNNTIYVNPDDIDEIVGGMQSILELKTEQIKNEIIQKYSWENVASLTLKYITQYYEDRRKKN